jgi:hypothetical protein
MELWGRHCTWPIAATADLRHRRGWRGGLWQYKCSNKGYSTWCSPPPFFRGVHLRTPATVAPLVQGPLDGWTTVAATLLQLPCCKCTGLQGRLLHPQSSGASAVPWGSLGLRWWLSPPPAACHLHGVQHGQPQRNAKPGGSDDKQCASAPWECHMHAGDWCLQAFT